MRRGLQALAIGIGLVLLGLTIQLLTPLFTSATVETPIQGKAKVPGYAYEPWYPLAVQDGRTKPFQTACVESVRHITGRTHFEGLDPVAVELAWMLGGGAAIPQLGDAQASTDWETYPFILCDHHGLRRQIMEHLLDSPPSQGAGQPNGKYMSPAELRRSPAFDRLLGEIARKRKELQGKAHLELTTEHLKAEEVGRRLLLFDNLCGKSITRLFQNALAGDNYLDLREYADILDRSPDEALARLDQQTNPPNPFHLVGLDRAPDSGWFSLDELRWLQQDWERWRILLAQRLRKMPLNYLGSEIRKVYQQLEQRSKLGKGRETLAEIRNALQERREANLRQFKAADRAGDRIQANIVFHKLVLSHQDQGRFHQARARLPGGTASLSPMLLEELRTIVREADEALLNRLATELELAEKAGFQGAASRMVHLDCLEKLFPDLYKEALAAQSAPQSQIEAVLKAFEQVRAAYHSGEPLDFDEASRAFFKILADTTDNTTFQGLAERLDTEDVQGTFAKLSQAQAEGSAEQIRQAKEDFFQAVADTGETVEVYPGVSTIPLELRFNSWQPFLWSWITMLAALILLALGLGFGLRVGYRLGLTVYLGSLVVQTIGFTMRMAISGRAPVSNMYESVIFAAFMAALLGLILEWIYRRGFIALAGAAVGTLGLVLADQLPLAMDPKISPMVPVLRTNYWLTVHVLTIVSSYAAGTLAWGLGNLTLGLLVFHRAQVHQDRATLKTLAHYTYRTLQIAVLLLATGTFLGGWWAAESWGRFWGWDPKEVGALLALVCYVIPLHARYLGWVQDFGLAVAAVLCYASILLSWYVVNFLVAAGLHSYGFSTGGGVWVLWASLLNIEWVLIATLLYQARSNLAAVSE